MSLNDKYLIYRNFTYFDKDGYFRTEMTPEVDRFLCIVWLGFKSSAEELELYGWKIRVYFNPYSNKIILKLINNQEGVASTLKMPYEKYKDIMSIGGSHCFHFTNMHSPNLRSTKQPPLDKIVPMTEDDVPMLLETANKLLESNRKKHISQIELPEADIIYLNKLTKYFHTYGNID